MIKEIEEKIIEGLKSTYQDLLKFNKEQNSIIKPEYIITVNIAQKISDINSSNNPDDYPIRIKLEERARKFLSLCKVYDLATDFNELFTMNKWRILESNIIPKSKQRLDIAIYNKKDEPISVIEVKKFTEYPTLLLKDINRNLNFLGWYNSKLYDSLLKTAFIVFLINDKDSVRDTEINTRKSQIKSNYDSFISNLNIDQSIKVEINVETLSESLLNQTDNSLPDDFQQDKFEKRHHFLYVIIKFERK